MSDVMSVEPIVTEDEADALDFNLINRVCSKLIEQLRFKEVAKIARPESMVALNEVVEHIIEYTNNLSYVVRANKPKAILLKRVSGILNDILKNIRDLEFSSSDCPDVHVNLKDALAKVAEVFDTSNPSTLTKFDSSTLFAMASSQAEDDLKFFKSNRKSPKNKVLHKRITADILLHCSPTISDSDAARVGLKFRIVDGYVHIRDQKILMIDSVATDDQYTYARRVAREMQNKLVPMESIYYAKGGIAYAWFVKPKVITDLFATLQINAWCCVRNKS